MRPLDAPLPVENPALALHGAPPSVTHPNPRPKRFGAEELAQLEEMVEQPSLFYWKGPQTALLVERFRAFYPLEYVMPCSSGTAAIHIAVAAAGIGPGDEVIVPPITDMGSVIGILYQQGVPVFADLEAHRYNLDVLDVERKISPRTRAILAVHLTGNPCDMAALRALADKHDLILIEDCAQAWGASFRGQPVGTLGHLACFSLNDFKHISCGDGGLVASSDPKFGPFLQKFGDKAYDRSGGGRQPDVLAPNYRISEPQSAVGAAQMPKMPEIARKRGAAGRKLSALLGEIPGVYPHFADAGDDWTCWFYLFRIDPAVLKCDNADFAAALTAEGVGCKAGYIGTPLYRYPVFQDENFFAGRWPVKELGLTAMDYKTVCCPVAEEILATCIQIPLSETTPDEWIEQAAAAIAKIAQFYRN